MEGSSPARLYATLVGGTLVVAGIIGFFYDASFDTGDSLQADDVFGVLAVNGWHNIVHILTGALGLLVAGYAARAYAQGAYAHQQHEPDSRSAFRRARAPARARHRRHTRRHAIPGLTMNAPIPATALHATPCPAIGYEATPNAFGSPLLTNTLSADPSAFLRSVQGVPVV